MGSRVLNSTSHPTQSTKQVAVITLFPEMFSAITESGITRRAVEGKLIELEFHNPRNYTEDRHQTVDDRPYGGGPGMVMRVEPLVKALKDAREGLIKKGITEVKVIYLSPQGQALNQQGVEYLYQQDGLILVAGRYEGIDERFIDRYVDEEWSIGDYVLSGGELPAMVMLDAIIRKIPGALGDSQSAIEDSFEQGLLDYPHYTRPEQLTGEYGGGKVPEVLVSGDHGRIRQWREKQSLGRTFERRPELLRDKKLSDAQESFLNDFQKDPNS